jgi:hypothetical protein
MTTAKSASPKPRSSSRMPVALVAALALATSMLLPGCTNGAAASTRIIIDFPDPHADVDDAVPIAKIEGIGSEVNAHNQLLAWAAATGTDVDVSSFSFGHCVDAIDHLPETPGCSMGATAYWALSFNGQEASSGMDEILLADGDVVTWTYTPLGNSSSSASGPKLTVDAPAPTQEAMLMLTGTLDRDARLSVTGAKAVDAEAGSWMVHVPIDVGHTPLTITADDGSSSTQLQVVAVRLASATFQAKFTMAVPPHSAVDDLVWYDPAAMVSASLYNGTDVQHPPAATVHDLMVTWSNQTGKGIVYSYFAGLGFSPDKIDGVGQPLTSSAPPYWCYKLNGATSDFGISLQEVHPGDVVTWEYAGCA